VVGKSVEQAERELILRALLDIKGNILELRDILAAQAHGVDPAPRGAHRGEEGEIAEQASLSLEEMERRMIGEALERYKGNRRIAARALNISERTLYRKIKEYNLG